MEVISFAIKKGGTGKSSISSNCSALINKSEKYKCLLIDADGQGNSSTCMGIKEVKYSLYDCLSKGISFEDAVIKTPFGDVLGGNEYLDLLEEELFTNKHGTASKYKLLKKFINEQIKPQGYSHIIIDLAPNFGNVFTLCLIGSSKIIVPVTPSELSMEGITQFLEIFESIQEENEKLELLAVIFNMCNVKTKEYKRLQSQLKAIFHDKLLDFVIPQDQKMVESQNSQNFKDNIAKPCTIAFPYSRASMAIGELVDLILKEGV